MKIHTSDKAIAWLTLFSGLTISAVAIYYSVAGLTAIFAAAVIPIIVMGVALEISKLAATVWLKQNWSRAPNFIRGYLLAAIAILMIITSMGIFGFLSKAHSDQSLVSGDVQSKIAVYDEKIKAAKDNIEAARKALKQMDEAVDQTMARSTSEEGATKANNIRRAQQRERSSLAKEIEANQKLIAALNDESAPIRAEVRKVEAEVGPIKYIAAFIYGDNPDANLLEKAVTWVIIIIVVVFDPLAVILLLASQYSFMWFRKQQDEDEEVLTAVEQPIIQNSEPQEEKLTEDSVEDRPTSANPHPVGWMFPRHAPIQEYSVEDADEEPTPAELDVLPVNEQDDDHKIIDDAPDTEKQAMKAWKRDHPTGSLKHQRVLLERGMISRLPWEDYIVAREAKKWAEENPETEEAQQAQEWANEKLDERPGDYLPEGGVSYMENVDGHQIKKTIDGYQQNEEQSESTIWKRIKDSKQ